MTIIDWKALAETADPLKGLGLGIQDALSGFNYIITHRGLSHAGEYACWKLSLDSSEKDNNEGHEFLVEDDDWLTPFPYVLMSAIRNAPEVIYVRSNDIKESDLIDAFDFLAITVPNFSREIIKFLGLGGRIKIPITTVEEGDVTYGLKSKMGLV